MKRTFLFAALAAALASCATDLRPNYDGLRCDPGGICPPGFDCVNNVCRGRYNPDGGDLCAGVSCTTPPSSQCQDANTKRVFTAGSCDKTSGQCVWTTQDTTCQMGCAQGLCIGDPCNTISCTTPPAPTCLNASTLRVFGNSGTCSNGNCSYPPTDTTCTNGCSNGQCVNQNLCTNVTCNTPPAPSCSGNNRISYSATGTCNPGTGQCSYTQSSTACPNGCSSGACITTALTFNQVQPQVRHRIDAIDVAPTSNGDRALAVGPAGAVSYFNGTAWAKLASGTANDLTGVWFSSLTTAWIVGKNRTVLRWNGTALSSVNNVPGSGSTNFVGVHGTSDTNVVLADETGGWYRFNGVSWSNGSLSATNQPYAMRAVFVDGTGKTRIAGRCATSSANPKGCVAYNDPFSTTNPNTWYEDLDGSGTTTSDGFLAVGPTPNALSAANEAWVGRFPSTAMRRHDGSTGNFDDAGVPALPAANGVVGITGTAPLAPTRLTYVLTGVGTTSASNLYRATGTGLEQLFDFYFNAQWLSRNDSAGVLVADARFPTAGFPNEPIANDIVRRGPSANEALDLGEDWVGFDTNTFPVGAGGASVQAVVVVSGYNDIAIRPASNGTRWVFRRGPAAEATDVVAGQGTAFITGRTGALYRFTIATGFSKVTLSPTSANDLNAICRVTDSEMYVVGNGGVIYSYGAGSTATGMASPTLKNLFDVHCPNTGAAIACGQDGTVLQLKNNTWSAVTPAFPNATAQLTSCRQVGNTVFVAGDGVFYKLEAGAWTQLPNRAQLSDLVPLSPVDVYATSGADVVRFDGTAWTSRFTSPQVLRAGGQVGARVVYAGGAGVVVEGQ